MLHDENHNPMTNDNRTHTQVTECDSAAREEINLSQQHHGIDSLNGETLNCDANEAQTPAEVVCNVNETFKTEDNFVNPWQKSWTEHEKEEHKQQCAQQHVLNKGLKMHAKRGEDVIIKEITQSHNRVCFELIEVEDRTPEEK